MVSVAVVAGYKLIAVVAVISVAVMATVDLVVSAVFVMVVEVVVFELMDFHPISAHCHYSVQLIGLD